ncbi:MAG: hypothetical protein IJK35_02805 [Oscillospiraceae bacterium]|nr:hypothetical protein [Oscillospiraceae bacterium]
MRSFFSFRLSAQLCLVSGLLCTLPVFRGDWRMLVLLALLSFFACCFAVRVSQLGGRLFLGMLPLAVLPLASGTPSLVACGLLAGYAALSLTLGRFTQEHWRYRKEAALTLLVCGLAELLTVVNEPIYNLPSCLFFLAAALGTIVALRSLRIGFAHRIGWQLGSPVAVLSLATLGVGLTVFGLPLLKTLFLPFGSVLTALLRLLSSGMTAFFRLIFGDANVFEAEAETVVPTVETDWVPETVQPRVTREDGWLLSIDVAELGKWIAFALACAAMLLLVVWLLRRSVRLEKTKQPVADLREERAQPITAEPRRRRRTRGTEQSRNRRRIRAAYREYLAYLRRNQIDVRTSDTTAEITDRTSAELLQSDETLRSIYRLARYSDAEPDDAAVAAAEAALAALTTKKKTE